jgi:hypothetical protein
MTVFGALRHGGQVEDAVLASFTRWLPDYLAEVARQEGLSGPTSPSGPSRSSPACSWSRPARSAIR